MQAAGYGPANHLALTLVLPNGAQALNFANAVVSQLSSIYIDVTFSQRSDFFTFVPNNPTGYDLTLLGWSSDTSDSENMLSPLLEGASSPTPGNTNWARFDDAAANDRFAYARGLSGSARLAEYVSIDADLATNAAPLAAFSDFLRAAVTSARLGCFIGHAFYTVSLPRLCERTTVPPNESYSSGVESTPSEPVASVQTPTGGPVAISPGPRSSDTSGYRMLGQELSIEAPAATVTDPLVITFELDAAVMAAKGLSYTDVLVVRNNVPVPDCNPNEGDATPDPCLSSRTLQGDGDAVFVVLTSHASIWGFGAPDSTAPALNSAALSPSTIIAGESTSLSVAAAADADRAELYVDSDAGPGLNSALNGAGGSFTSPPFGSLLAPGSHTIGVRVGDEAGNWSPVTLRQLVVLPPPSFVGFFSPTKNPPAENSEKTGATVNLSFSLGMNYGLDVFANGSPKLRAYSCGSTPSGSYTALPAGSWKLGYDSAHDRYKLSWKTTKGTTGCRELLLEFRGGATATARFSFR
jgi:hypothetical protein